MAAAIIVGVTQNSQRVEVKYFVWDGHASLAVVLLATVVLTVALTTVAGVVWRRSRRRRLTQRDELQSLRAVTATSASDGPSTPAPVDRPKQE